MCNLSLKAKVVTICFIVLGTITCYSQKNADKVFNNVIKIDNEHITTDGRNFLFDVALTPNKKIPVVYLNEDIPYNLLSTAYPDLAQLILIISDWVYYKSVRESLKGSQIAFRPGRNCFLEWVTLKPPPG